MSLSQKNSCNLHLEVIKGQLLGSFFIQQLSFRTCAKLFWKEKVALKTVSHLSTCSYFMQNRPNGHVFLPQPHLIHFSITPVMLYREHQRREFPLQLRPFTDEQCRLPYLLSAQHLHPGGGRPLICSESKSNGGFFSGLAEGTAGLHIASSSSHPPLPDHLSNLGLHSQDQKG